MMRKAIFTLSALVFLAACSSTTPVGPATEDPNARLRKAVLDSCGWLPVAQTLGSLVPSATAGVAAFSAVAAKICEKVQSTPVPAGEKKAFTVEVDGQRVSGAFAKNSAATE
ncbi:hypothetical protein [Mesorhizobium sp. M0522]|uniref:lipoprotein n=1 Tax=Mesorhizobium sp. M0522 TaxID=2956958 RepID=UPI0033387E36